MRIDIDPYGFFGSVQAITPGTRTTKAVALELVEIYLGDKRTEQALRDAVVTSLCDATSYDQANKLARLLNQQPERVSPDHLTRLRKAQKSNSQVSGAFDVEPLIGAVESALKISKEAGYEDEPF